MIAWQGTGPGRLGNALVFVHDFSLYLRAPEEADVGYEDLFNWIVNDVPAGSSLRMLHTAKSIRTASRWTSTCRRRAATPS